MSRGKLSAFLLALSLPAFGGDVVDRAQIPTRIATAGEASRYVSTLAMRMPLFQIVPVSGGGGVSGAVGPLTSLTVGTTTTAGTATCVIDDTMAGASATDNFFSCTGTTPTTLTNPANFANFQVTTAGSSSQIITGLNLDLLAGYTGSSATRGGYFTNNVLATGVGAISFGSTNPVNSFGGNVALTGAANVASSAGLSHAGVQGLAHADGGAGGTTFLVGVYGGASSNRANAQAVGVAGVANTAVGNGIAGQFELMPRSGGNNFQAFASAALVASNGTSTADIFDLYDGTTLKVAVLDGGNLQVGNNQLSASTMTMENNALVSVGLASATWTNAQVVALGASLTGDINVLTLPAKTQVRNAYVVITGAAAGPTTVTVSCGDAIAGTPFINYIVASDAKAAANTVYGDAVAERGTSLDVEFYYLPSYTATTLVTCHFISTVQNLDQVTGSTGRVILQTVTLP